MKTKKRTIKALLWGIAFLCSLNAWSVTEVNVSEAGTLSTLLTNCETKLKVTGVINGTDIKYIRSLVTAGTVTSIDWPEVRIVSGGEAYYGTFTTANDVIGEQMFTECANLQEMILPTTVTSIQSNAFSRTGLKAIDIPNSVTRLGMDAFAYCSSLADVVIGAKVKQMDQGVFWSSEVKNAYVKPVNPPAVPYYLFGSNPKIYVYSVALSDYKATDWNGLGTVVGGLENYYSMEADPNTVAKAMNGKYFEDAACTQLKPEYQAMPACQGTAQPVYGSGY